MVMGYTHKHICHLFVCHAFLAPLLSFQKWTGAAAVSFSSHRRLKSNHQSAERCHKRGHYPLVLCLVIVQTVTTGQPVASIS
jgi:hypothetical protein